MPSISGRVCRYSNAEAAHVEWVHFDVDEETWTCFHHARLRGADMVAAGWARVTEDEWLPEENRLQGAL
jgi:hypothetical protein